MVLQKRHHEHVFCEPGLDLRIVAKESESCTHSQEIV